MQTATERDQIAYSSPLRRSGTVHADHEAMQARLIRSQHARLSLRSSRIRPALTSPYYWPFVTRNALDLNFGPVFCTVLVLIFDGPHGS